MTPFRLWVYLQTTPLFWLTATLGAYLVADRLAQAARRHPLVNPVAIAIALVGALLKVTGADYQTYFNGAQFVHFLLGPATVALAVPLYRNLELVRRNLLPMAAALVVGALTAIVSALVVARALGAPRAVLVSLAPKSVTAGVAMAVSETLGGAAAADRGPRHRDRHSRRDHGDAADECAQDTRLCGAGICGGPRLARHRHGAGLSGRSGRRRVRGNCDGAERGRDAGDHSRCSCRGSRGEDARLRTLSRPEGASHRSAVSREIARP